jgi:hypothetical protein
MQCPHCAARVRAVGTRLVCDACAGMLIATAELAESLHDLDGATTELVVEDVQPDRARCPRCGNALESCRLRAGKHALAGRALRCPTDGVWIANDALVAEYARAGRRGRAGGRSFGGRAAAAQLDIAAKGGLSAALAGIGRAFAAPRSAISTYHVPRIHTVFVSAYRGQPLACPACADRPLVCEGDRWVCGGCAGTFVEDAALVAMVSDIAHAPWTPPPATGAASTRACPVCKQAMVGERIGGVTIERCVAHGHWFDDDELAAALQHAADPPKSTAGWLRRLFHRG